MSLLFWNMTIIIVHTSINHNVLYPTMFQVLTELRSLQQSSREIGMVNAFLSQIHYIVTGSVTTVFHALDASPQL